MVINDPEFSKKVSSDIDKIFEKAISDDKELSKLILLISTGAVGISITLFTSISDISSISPIILVISWISLGVCIIMQVLGYYFSRKDAQESGELLNELADDQEILTKSKYNNFVREQNKAPVRQLINRLNIGVIISFIVGIILLFVYSSLVVMNKSKIKTEKEFYWSQINF